MAHRKTHKAGKKKILRAEGKKILRREEMLGETYLF